MKTTIKGNMIPYHVIVAAVTGDADALVKVVEKYDAYINKISSKRICIDNDRYREAVDEELKKEISAKLMESIAMQQFKINIHK